jgi:predicted RNA methylase
MDKKSKTLKNLKKSYLPEGEGFSSVDLVYQCLIDKDKFNAFSSVLKKYISNSSKILDIGTGSGILALIAGKLGAKNVLAVEFDPTVSKIANNNFKQNNLSHKIKIITGDARILDLSKYKFDLIVMELLATGLVDEMQVEVVNSLYDQGLISSNTIVVPFAQENYLTLAYTDFNLYGFNMKMIKHLWSHDNNDNSFDLISDQILMNRIVFNTKNNTKFSKSFNFKIKKTGKINSIYLTSNVFVDGKGEFILGSTHSLSPMVFIPIEDRNVKKGEIIKLKVSYLMGGGFNNFKINYIK